MSDHGPLRQLLDQTIAEEGGSMKGLTVLAPQNDPFRLDTPARHRDGEWLATTARDLGLGDRKIHLRGLHYMVLGRPKPNGQPYTNTEADWLWLSEDCGKAARFLGYLPFDQVVDNRNAAPEVRTAERPDPWPYIYAELSVEIPSADDLMPFVGVSGFTGLQPYRLVMVGEKSSLAEVLGPAATRYGADLYLPTGCMSDTLFHRMAADAAADGRPLVVFYFADCDPSGWNMPVEASRKLQALKTLLFGDLEFEVHRVALTPEQVREHDLPSTPLKDTEKRAERWIAAQGVEQTEIDALASLRPDLLRRIAGVALDPYFDETLDQRVRAAKRDWQRAAQDVVMANLDGEQLARIRLEAQEALARMAEDVRRLNEEMRLSASDVDLPDAIVPEPVLRDRDLAPDPLVDSRWPFLDQCRRLIASKAYQ